MRFVDERLAEFRKSEPGTWKGIKLSRWLELVRFTPSQTIQDEYLNRPLTREDFVALRKYLSPTATQDLCACIFAWGGMKFRHGIAIFGHSDKRWLAVAHNLRTGKIDRFEAYNAFNELSIGGHMPGVGPAYFTKLLFFLPERDEQRGLIMDQWTGRSINLLTGLTIVKLTSGYIVDKSNSVDQYRQFLEAVAALSELVHGDASPAHLFQTELCLFSQGGKKKLGWRRYVDANRAQTPR